MSQSALSLHFRGYTANLSPDQVLHIGFGEGRFLPYISLYYTTHSQTYTASSYSSNSLKQEWLLLSYTKEYCMKRDAFVVPWPSVRTPNSFISYS
jgi:hypothetical protein